MRGPSHELGDGILHLQLEETSIYQPGLQDSESSSSNSTDSSNGIRTSSDSIVSTCRRVKLNEFLWSCDAPAVGPSKKRWVETGARTKKVHVSKAKALVVAGLEVIAPGDAGHLWEALRDFRDSGTVEKEFGIAEESPEKQKYLSAIAESYLNASCWETRRQVRYCL